MEVFVDSRINDQGMTYIEVLISTLLFTSIVGAFSLSMSTSDAMQHMAQEHREVSLKREGFIEEFKYMLKKSKHVIVGKKEMSWDEFWGEHINQIEGDLSEDYSYEVILWDINDLDIEEKGQIDISTLEGGVKIGSFSEKGEEDLINLTITKEMLSDFLGEQSDKNYFMLLDRGEVEMRDQNEQELSLIAEMPIYNLNNKLEGYTYRIEKNSMKINGIQDSVPITLDLTQLSLEDPYTIYLKNKEIYDLIIKVYLKEGQSLPYILTHNIKNNEVKPCSISISRKVPKSTKTYMILWRIRQLNPILGEPEKLLDQGIDFISY